MAGLIRSLCASSRTDGTAVPGANAPSAIRRRTSSSICFQMGTESAGLICSMRHSVLRQWYSDKGIRKRSPFSVRRSPFPVLRGIPGGRGSDAEGVPEGSRGSAAPTPGITMRTESCAPRRGPRGCAHYVWHPSGVHHFSRGSVSGGRAARDTPATIWHASGVP